MTVWIGDNMKFTYIKDDVNKDYSILNNGQIVSTADTLEGAIELVNALNDYWKDK